MVYQHRVHTLRKHIIEQWLDKIDQMINLLEFAPAILIQLPVTGQNMQLFEQIDGLIGLDFWNILHTVILIEKLFLTYVGWIYFHLNKQIAHHDFMNVMKF